MGEFPSKWVVPFLEARSGGSTWHCKPLVLSHLRSIRWQPMTYETLRLDLWMGDGLDFVILFFTIIVCFFKFRKPLGSMIFLTPANHSFQTG